MKFSEIKKPDTELIKVQFQDNEIGIKPYISIADKYDLVMITLQKAMEDNGIYNPVKLEQHFNLNLVYMYTDIDFSDEEKLMIENEAYDLLEMTGLFDLVHAAIPESELKLLKQFLEETEEKLNNINTSVLGAVIGIINSLPVNAATAAKMLKDFDPSKLQEAMQFARSIGADVE